MIFTQIQGLFMTMRLWDILDILVVAFSCTGCICSSAIPAPRRW